MTIVIHNAAIVTVDDRDTVHYDAAIAIEADRIAAIGPNAEILARYPAAERIDGAGKLIMPGLANIHTHLTMTLARGVFEDLSPSHKPPFSGGLSPIPLPDMNPDERRVMAQLELVAASSALRDRLHAGQDRRLWDQRRTHRKDQSRLSLAGRADQPDGVFQLVRILEVHR